MDELLLKVRVAIKRMFTQILWFTLSPLKNDVIFVVKAIQERLIQCGDTCLVLVSLVLKIGNPEYG